jgi:1-phosphatidylinositol-3-phosphate 5-kinase
VRDLREAEKELCDTYNATSPGRLNDARQLFVSTEVAIRSKVAEWKKENGIQSEGAVPIPNLPEYAGGKGVHALPGGSVLVREDEPSSIIAYTLS